MFEPDATPEVEKTVLLVSLEYIQRVANTNFARIEPLVFWTDYIGKTGVTPFEYQRQLSWVAKQRWTQETHPLFHLDVVDIDVDENNSEVVLRKNAPGTWPKIKISLIWSGNGWLVVGDNLFGDKGVFATAASPQ